MCEVENVEFNSDGALGITVYRGQRKGSASTSDLSEKAIHQTVLAALDIAHYTSEDPYAGPAPKALMVKDIPDLDLFHPDEPNPDRAASIAIAAEREALNYSSKIKQSDGASYDSHYGVKVYGNSHGLLASYASSRHSISCSVIGEGKMARWSVTIAIRWHVIGMTYGHPSVLVNKRQKNHSTFGCSPTENGSISGDVCCRCRDWLNGPFSDGDQWWQSVS